MVRELTAYIQLIQEERYVDAHVVLEEPWKSLRAVNKDEGNILKGLINAASALELKRLGRDDAARKIWKAYEKYRPLIQTVHSPHGTMYQACAQAVEAIAEHSLDA